jgi:hypothetical protein
MDIRATSAVLFALTLTHAPAACAAQGLAISRCSTSDGVAAYTDRSCAAIGARSAPMSLSLVRNLAREGGAASEEASHEIQSRGIQSRGIRLDGIGAIGASRVPAFAGCPRTPEQLQAAFEQSVASGDVNQLAAIYDWTDVTGRQSRDLLRRLDRMSHSRLQDVSMAGGVRRRAGCLLLGL